MKQLTFIIGLVIISFTTRAQERKDFTIALQSGITSSPYYKNAQMGLFSGLDFSYQLTKKHIIAANYFYGAHEYFDDVLSNVPESQYVVNPERTNSKASYNNFSVLYKYRAWDKSKFSITPGAGAGMLTHSRRFPYSLNNNQTMTFFHSSATDLVFPVNVDMDFNLLKNMSIGLTSGLVIHPDFPISNYLVGSRIAYTIR